MAKRERNVTQRAAERTPGHIKCPLCKKLGRRGEGWGHSEVLMDVVPGNIIMGVKKNSHSVINILGPSLDRDNFIEWTTFLEVVDNIKITKNWLKVEDSQIITFC